jgi:hypothetical protein
MISVHMCEEEEARRLVPSLSVFILHIKALEGERLFSKL